MRGWSWIIIVLSNFSFAQITTPNLPFNRFYLDIFEPSSKPVNRPFLELKSLISSRSYGTDLSDCIINGRWHNKNTSIGARFEYGGSPDWNKNRVSTQVNTRITKQLRLGCRLGLGLLPDGPFDYWTQCMASGQSQQGEWSVNLTRTPFGSWEPLISWSNLNKHVLWKVILNKESTHWQLYAFVSKALPNNWGVSIYGGTGIWGNGIEINHQLKQHQIQLQMNYIDGLNTLRPVIKWTYRYEKRNRDMGMDLYRKNMLGTMAVRSIKPVGDWH